MKKILMDIIGLDESEISVLIKAVRKIKRKSKEELEYVVKKGHKTVNISSGLDISTNCEKEQYNGTNEGRIKYGVGIFMPGTPNEEVMVKFEMLGRDWDILEQSEEWGSLVVFLKNINQKITG